MSLRGASSVHHATEGAPREVSVPPAPRCPSAREGFYKTLHSYMRRLSLWKGGGAGEK